MIIFFVIWFVFGGVFVVVFFVFVYEVFMEWWEVCKWVEKYGKVMKK